MLHLETASCPALGCNSMKQAGHACSSAFRRDGPAGATVLAASADIALQAKVPPNLGNHKGLLPQVRASVLQGITDMANRNLESDQLISELRNQIAIVR